MADPGAGPPRRVGSVPTRGRRGTARAEGGGAVGRRGERRGRARRRRLLPRGPDPTTMAIERHRDLGVEPLFAVEFRDPAAERLRRERDERVDNAFRRSLDCAAAAHLHFAVGAAERTLEMTVAYARNRIQFGRPIGSFQAVAHRCVDMRTDLDACRYLIYRAAWALDQGAPSALDVASAQAYGTEALRRRSCTPTRCTAPSASPPSTISTSSPARQGRRADVGHGDPAPRAGGAGDGAWVST